MDDAGLDLGLRIDRLDGFRESAQSIHAGDKDILDASVFQLGHSGD